MLLHNVAAHNIRLHSCTQSKHKKVNFKMWTSHNVQCYKTCHILSAHYVNITQTFCDAVRYVALRCLILRCMQLCNLT